MPLVELLAAQFLSLDELAASLAPREWYQRTALPGWAVIDVFAHLIGAELAVDGEEPPPATVDVSTFDHVLNQIGVLNERWIESMADQTPEELLHRFRQVVAARLGALAALSNDEWHAVVDSPIGPVPYWRFMQIRLFDAWMHEQDIRECLIRPGNESGRLAEAAVEEVQRMLGYVVGKRAGAAPGSTVTFELVGPVYQTIHMAVDDRAEVVDHLDTTPTTTVRLSSSLLLRLSGGRLSMLPDRLGGLEFEGDLDLARRIVAGLSFTV